DIGRRSSVRGEAAPDAAAPADPDAEAGAEQSAEQGAEQSTDTDAAASRLLVPELIVRASTGLPAF
ncbi:MAG TPA: hypothetical protein VIP54_00495, partial [Microterricola sp.]